MPIEHITDLDARAAALILYQFHDKPRIMAILGALAIELQALEDAHDQILNETTIASAIGTQLDTIGRIVGEGRAGLDDDAYRARIRVRLFINRSNGRHGEFLRALSLFEGHEDEGVFELREVFPAGLRLTQHDEPVTSTAEITILLRRMKGGGIRLDYVYDTAPREEAFVFGGLPLGLYCGTNGVIRGSYGPGATWTAQTSGVATTLNAIAFNGFAYAACGAGGVTRVSFDGITYQDPTSGSATGEDVHDLIAIDSLFVGCDNQGRVVRSLDGDHWYLWGGGHPDLSPMRGLAWSGSVLLVVGDLGDVIRIVEPFDFTAIDPGTYPEIGDVATWYGVAWGGTTFVLVGEGGRIRTSPSGLTATYLARVSGTAEDLRAVAYDETFATFVAVGTNGTILLSSDAGATWGAATSGTLEDLYDVDAREGRILVSGANGTLLLSIDGGATFVAQTSGTAEDIRGARLADVAQAEGMGMDHEADPVYGGALAGVVTI